MIRVITKQVGEIKSPVQVTSQSLERVGSRAKIMIARRTAKGVDVSGQKFRAYETKYAKFRAFAGRQIAYVDLNFTGKMMGSIQYTTQPSQGRVTLFFPPSEAGKAHGNQERWKRRFFELSDAELNKLGPMLVAIGGRRGQ